jgi:tetratricopeptide (TPR) repeat protein
VHRAEIGRPEAKNPEAYQNYLKAKFTFGQKQDRSDVDIAMGLYALALKEEPSLLAARAGLAEIMLYNGDTASARIELESALKQARQQGLKAEQAELLVLSARMHVKQSAWEEAQRCGEEARAISVELEDRAGEVEALGVLIAALRPQSKFDEAIQLFDRVLQLSRELDDQEKVAEVLKNMGIMYARTGDYDRALDLYDEALEMARQQKNVALEAACMANKGNVHFFQGQLDKAYAAYEEANELAERIGNEEVAAKQKMNMALIHMNGNRTKEGLPLIQKAGESFQRLGDQINYALSRVNESQALVSLGEADQAEAAAGDALEIARSVNYPLVEADALIQLSYVQSFRGELELARELCEDALEVAESSGLIRNQAHILIALGDISLRQEKYRECQRYARKARTLSKETGEKVTEILAVGLAAAAEASQGLFNAGLRQLEDAVKRVEEVGTAAMIIRMKATLGRVLLKHGDGAKDAETGRKRLNEALDLARTHELAPEMKIIEQIQSA